MKKTFHSKVMVIANKLVKQGYSRANAMLKAWVLVKMPLVETKVAGVTFGKRQKAIEHLTRYQPEQISIQLQRDSDNERDRNAVAVLATVEGKGSYKRMFTRKCCQHSLDDLQSEIPCHRPEQGGLSLTCFILRYPWFSPSSRH